MVTSNSQNFMGLFDKLSAGYNIGKFVKDACSDVGIRTTGDNMLQREDIFRILDHLHASQSKLIPRLTDTFARTLAYKLESKPYFETSAEQLTLDVIRQAKLDTGMNPFGSNAGPTNDERRIIKDLFR